MHSSPFSHLKKREKKHKKLTNFEIHVQLVFIVFAQKPSINAYSLVRPHLAAKTLESSCICEGSPDSPNFRATIMQYVPIYRLLAFSNEHFVLLTQSSNK